MKTTLAIPVLLAFAALGTGCSNTNDRGVIIDRTLLWERQVLPAPAADANAAPAAGTDSAARV